MAKQLDTLKEMSQVLDKTEEAIQKYYDAVEQLPKKDAKILEDFKKVRDTLNKDSFQWTQEEFAIFDEADTKRKEALRTALVDREKFSKEEQEIYGKALAALKKVNKETEKERSQNGEMLKTISKKIQEEELLTGKKHASRLESIGENHLEGEQSRAEAIAELTKRGAEATETLSGILVKDKTPETWEKKWDNVAKKTADYTNALNSSTKEMFGAITKNIDQDIAKTKEEIAEQTKKITSAKEELTLVQKRSAEELAKSKADLLAKEGNEEGGNVAKMKGELEEMENLYNLEQELRTKNEQHKDDADYQDLTITTDQQNRLTQLQDDYKTYAQSLEDKTNADKQAAEKVSKLEKEKEEKDKEVKKKEKQKKKVEAAQQVVQATVNIAQGITKAWALGPIAGPIMAAIVGAAGAIQLTYMGKQISKLEDGGLLSGKRHSQGGMPILGSNIEVEGGEYVVNRQSTGKNLGLLGYINSQRRELGANDLNNYFSESPTSLRSMFQNELAHAGEVPQMEPQVSVSNAQLLEAIQGINFSPRVSVTDINTVHDNMVKVDEWTGL